MRRTFHINNQELSVTEITITDNTIRFLIEGEAYQCDIIPIENGYKALVEEKAQYHLFVGKMGAHGRRHVFVDGKEALVAPAPRSHKRQAEAGSFTAPMPGKVIEVHVKPGDKVHKGQKIVTMEAMKLQHTLHAPEEGVVEEVYYAVGTQVSEGVLLVRLREKDVR